MSPLARAVSAVVDAPALRQQGLVLTVGDDGTVQLLGQGHGGAHHVLRLDAPAVVYPATEGAMAARSASSVPCSPCVMAP